MDSSIALALVLPDPERIKAGRLWREWRKEGAEVVAPWLFPFEVRSVLRQRVVRGDLGDRTARQAWDYVTRLEVRCIHDDRLLDLAWDLAVAHGQATIYDTAYLALAKLLGCECWTFDRKFADRVGAGDRLLKAI